MSDPLLMQTAGGFQEWWERQCLDVAWFNHFRDCWFAAQLTQLRNKRTRPVKKGKRK